MRTLYLCYFGLCEPLVQTQVLTYLRQLSRGGIDVGLLTFEPNRRPSWSRSETGDWCDRVQADGIRWFSLPYHKRPSLPATTYDIAAGGWMAARLVRRHGYDVVHARAHMAAAKSPICPSALSRTSYIRGWSSSRPGVSSPGVLSRKWEGFRSARPRVTGS